MSATAHSDFIATQPAIDDWPAPPAAEAYYGVAGDFVQLIEGETEADRTGLLLTFLITAGSMFGRDAYAVADGSRHYPCEFVIMVGESGKSRKGTSARHVRNIANRVIENFSKDHELSGLSSGEGLVKGMQNGKELGIYNFLGYLPEFSQLLTVARREGNTISAILRQAWDGDPLRVLTKNQPLSVGDYSLAILGHITPDELLNGLSAVDMVNGMANRFLFARIRRSKFLPLGGNDVNVNTIVTRLHHALDAAKDRGRVCWSKGAEKLWCEIYPKLADPPAGLKGSLCARGDAHTLRLSLIYSLLDGAPEIQLQHLEAAAAVWNFCDRSVASIFARRLGDPEAEKINRAVETGPKTLSELHRVFGNNRTSDWLLAKIAAMVKAGLLVQTIKECDRKSVTAWDKKRV